MRILVAVVGGALASVAPAPASADPGDVIVRFAPGAGAAQRADARRDADVRRKAGLAVPGLELADPQAGVTAAEAVEALEREPAVLYAERDVTRRAFARPSDRLFRYQWALENLRQNVDDGDLGVEDADIDATDAWDAVTGSPSVVVAVVDSGIDAAHPDLAPNLFVNPRETPANEIDDDGNGFVDDVSGWDFADGDRVPGDLNGHGTHVAGTVAAQGDDGGGVAGVAWDAAILPLRALGADGSGSTSAVIRAYGYAVRMGAGIVNLSLGGDLFSRAERDAIAAAPNVLFVAAAGNESADNDATASYPCNHDLANVVCVAASDRSDALASFSNRGARTVDLAAPGVAIASTYPDGGFALLDGTSMAAPHVSGAAALLLSRSPEASVAALRASLLGTVDRRPALEDVTATGGRLNAAAALGIVAARAAQQPAPREPAPESSPGAAAGASAPPPAPPPAQPSAGTPRPIAPPPDRGPPIMSVFASPRRDLGLLLRRGLRVRIRCSERCALRLTLHRGGATIASRRAVRTSAGTATVTVRLSARRRAQLRRVRSTRLELRITGADGADNQRTLTRRLTLRRR